jgi:hypothetical protein
MSADPPPFAPTAPRETRLELWRRWWRSQRRHRGFRYWLWFRGFPFLIVVLVLFIVNGGVNGWGNAYDVAIGIASPTTAVSPITAWPLSVAGWLLVPGVSGAVAGYIVTDFIARRRTQRVDELFPWADDD